MKHKLSLLIHGPVHEQWLERIFQDVKKFTGRFEKIVIVSYVSDVATYERLIAELSPSHPVLIIPCKDIINTGFFNINRHIKTVQTGLQAIPEDTLIIKLRNDQSVNFNSLSAHLENLPNHTILTTNCFTRADRLYHPSDMLLCGHLQAIKTYFSCPPMDATHTTHVLSVQKEYVETNRTKTALQICPESWLFRHYLENSGWHTKETFNDSFASLKKYIRLVDTWDIELRWKNKRTPLLPAGSIILPHYFTMRPFPDGPLETCRCINAHTFYDRLPSPKACYFILLSKIVFALGVRQERKKYKFVYTIKCCIYRATRCIASILPYALVKKSIPSLGEKIKRNKIKRAAIS